MTLESKFNDGEEIIFIDENRFYKGRILGIHSYRDNEFSYKVESNNEHSSSSGYVCIKERNIFRTKEDAINAIFASVDDSECPQKETYEFMMRIELKEENKHILEEIPFIVEDSLMKYTESILCVEK